jgi:hypothetical protein
MALSLRETAKKHEPQTDFYIFLVDKRLPEFSQDKSIIEIEAISTIPIEEMTQRYNLIELNTAVKPYCFEYIAAKQYQKIIYLDPDIQIFQPLNYLWENLDQYDYILAPHSLSPPQDSENPASVLGMLNVGVFNLGFLAVNLNEKSMPTMNWWRDLMRYHGKNDVINGQFYDQKACNLIPIFHPNTLICRHFGVNVAEWNLHERSLSKKDDKYLVQDQELLFFHFSSIHITSFEENSNRRKEVGKYQSPILKELIENYIRDNIRLGYEKLHKIPCHYKLQPNVHRASRWEIWSYRLKKKLGFSQG